MMNPEQAADHLAQVSPSSGPAPLGPYQALRPIVIPGGPGKLDLPLQAGDRFIFDGDELVNIRELVRRGLIKPVEPRQTFGD